MRLRTASTNPQTCGQLVFPGADPVTEPFGLAGLGISELGDFLVGLTEPVTVRDARRIVDVQLHFTSARTDRSEDRTRSEIGRFFEHLVGCGIDSIDAVNLDVVEEFVYQPVVAGRGWSEAKPSTLRHRLSAVRTVFKALRVYGIAAMDPTLDLGLPGGERRVARVATDAEIDRLHAAAPYELVPTTRACVIALAEAGATNREIGLVTAEDINLSTATAKLAGGARLDRRTNPLTVWGAEIIAERIAYLEIHQSEGADGLVAIGASTADSAAAVVSNAMRDLCMLAGIRPRLSVDAIRAWRARHILTTTGQIEHAATFLGVRSLDVAARMVEHDWRAT